MNRISTLFLFLTLLSSCNLRNQNQESTKPKRTNENLTNESVIFKEFIGKIPSRKLPIRFSCGLPDGPGTDHLWVSDFAKFNILIPKGIDLIYGAVEAKKNLNLIIFGQIGDDLYPKIFSYDNKGKIIDSLFLILNPCGLADEHQIPHSYAIIDKDLKIILIDTTKLIHYLENNKDYIIDSQRVTKKVYDISPYGKIISQ